jgi:hypothetical protein
MSTTNQALVSAQTTALTSAEPFDSAGELQVTREQQIARSEIETAIAIAKRFPRDEEAGYNKLMMACRRLTFASQAEYSFPRGGEDVKGPSVKLAREAMRCFANMRAGVHITHEQGEERQIRAFAWDVENNVRIEQDDHFRKLVQRRKKDERGRKTSETEWVPVDERDLREVTNRRGAIAYRNCVFQIVPTDWVEDALEICRQTIREAGTKDPEGMRRKLVSAFASLSITEAMLQTYLGHPIHSCNVDEIDQLRGIYQSIKDGNSTWQEYVTPTAQNTVTNATDAATNDLADKYTNSSPATTGAGANPPQAAESAEQSAPSPSHPSRRTSTRSRHSGQEPQGIAGIFDEASSPSGEDGKSA